MCVRTYTCVCMCACMCDCRKGCGQSNATRTHPCCHFILHSSAGAGASGREQPRQRKPSNKAAATQAQAKEAKEAAKRAAEDLKSAGLASEEEREGQVPLSKIRRLGNMGLGCGVVGQGSS